MGVCGWMILLLWVIIRYVRRFKIGYMVGLIVMVVVWGWGGFLIWWGVV